MLLISVALGALSGTGRLGPVPPPPPDSLRLQIEIRADSARAGSHSLLRVMLWNESDHPIQVIAPISWPNESALLEVKDGDGADVQAYNLAFPYEFPSGPTSPFAVRIPPGAFIGTEIPLSPDVATGHAGYTLRPGTTYQATLTLVVYAVGSWARSTLESNVVEWQE